VSCGAPLTGHYCSNCGEHAFDAASLTLRHFLSHTVAHEVLHFDGAIWRTLRLLFMRPGALALEFSAGRRRPYVNPFRLLLIAIVVYALIASSGLTATWNIAGVTASIAPAAIPKGLSVETTISRVDPWGLLRQPFAAKKERLENEAAAERFHERLERFAEPLSFANVLLLAAALHMCFRRKRRFLEDAAFSMHFVSFVLLTSVTLVLAMRVRRWFGSYIFLLIFSVAVWHFAYLSVAIRRFYLPGRWTGWPLSVIAALFLYVLNSAFMTAVQIAGAAIALAWS
jgi:hypothetical protein